MTIYFQFKQFDGGKVGALEKIIKKATLKTRLFSLQNAL